MSNLMKILKLLAGEDPLLEENKKLKKEIEGLEQEIEQCYKSISEFLKSHGQYRLDVPASEYIKCVNQEERDKFYEEQLNKSEIPAGFYKVSPFIYSENGELKLRLDVSKSPEASIERLKGEK